MIRKGGGTWRVTTSPVYIYIPPPLLPILGIRTYYRNRAIELKMGDFAELRVKANPKTLLKQNGPTSTAEI